MDKFKKCNNYGFFIFILLAKKKNKKNRLSVLGSLFSAGHRSPSPAHTPSAGSLSPLPAAPSPAVGGPCFSGAHPFLFELLPLFAAQKINRKIIISVHNVAN